MTIDDIVALLEKVVALANPEALLPVLKPFLPAPVYAVAAWAVAHKDCILDLVNALRGAFGSDGADLSEVADDVAACRALAA
jgi:hypothetical protein